MEKLWFLLLLLPVFVPFFRGLFIRLAFSMALFIPITMLVGRIRESEFMHWAFYILKWETVYWLLSKLLMVRSFKVSLVDLLNAFRRFLNSKPQTGVWVRNEFISDEARKRHTHIVGATGSGKTVLLETLIKQDIARGHGCIIIDPKGELSFFDRIASYCKSVDRRGDLFLLSAQAPDQSVSWNPCALGSTSELQTKFYNSAVFSEAHYAKHCERALLLAFETLSRESPNGFNMRDVVDVLRKLERREKNSGFEGLFLDLENLIASEWREHLGVDPRPEQELSILDVVQNGKILYVDLPTESKAVQSSRIGKLLLQEILLISGLRKSGLRHDWKKPFSVYVDEFDAFANDSFTTFLNKGRSSGFMIHLAHQTLSDLRKVSPHFLGQIMGNCNVRFIFRQDDPDDAELWARFIGTRMVQKVTEQISGGLTTGQGSQRMVHEFLVAPDRIKNLPVGVCILNTKSPKLLKEVKIPFKPFENASAKIVRSVGPIVRGSSSSKSFRESQRSPFDPKTWNSPNEPKDFRFSVSTNEKAKAQGPRV
jgi:hypothetical protein